MLYIIVPVHNRILTTLNFIESLYNQDFSDYKLVVVNDGSTDDTKSIILEKYPNTIVLDGNGGLFWGGGINLGLDYIEEIGTKEDYIAFANNDTILQKNTLAVLMNYASKEFSLFHSLVLKADETIISSGAQIKNWPFFITHHPLRGQKYQVGNYPNKISIDLMTARLVVFSFNILEFCNRIDTTNFPHYVGDNDFSMSLKKMGINTYVIPSSKCFIDVSTTGENPHKLKTVRSVIKSLSSIRSTNNLIFRYRFGKKHCPKVHFPFYLVSMISQVIILNIIKKQY